VECRLLASLVMCDGTPLLFFAAALGNGDVIDGDEDAPQDVLWARGLHHHQEVITNISVSDLGPDPGVRVGGVPDDVHLARLALVRPGQNSQRHRVPCGKFLISKI